MSAETAWAWYSARRSKRTRQFWRDGWLRLAIPTNVPRARAKNLCDRLFLLERWKWCGREDSNLHGIATASPSSWCVCQFRHCRTRVTHHILAASWEGRKRDGARSKTRGWRPKGRRYKSKRTQMETRHRRQPYRRRPARCFKTAFWPVKQTAKMAA